MKYQKYLDHCIEQGLTSESPIIDIIDTIGALIIQEGCGYGSGYTADQQDEDEAWLRAERIGVAIGLI